jgi:hypothetical protein
MDVLKKLIREKRPNIADSSVKTYASLLKNLFYKDEANKDKDIDIKWFMDVEKVMEILKEKTPQTRKTNLAAIIVLLDGKAPAEYVDQMNTDADKTHEEYGKQEKSVKQQENWIEYSELVELWNAKYKKVKQYLYSTEPKDAKERKELVSFMVMTITGGIFFTPRRSEWIYMKVKNYDPKTDNYVDMKNNQFVFQKYKTAKTMGKETVAFPKEFKAILLRYLKCVDNDYLIFNTKGEPMTNVVITQTLNSIYGKQVSTSMLRHIYLSHKYADMPSLKDLKATADGLGHSVDTMLEYIKK